MKYLEYRENIIRGSAGFPAAYYHLSPAHPRYYMPPHWHDEYEIIHVLSGTLNVMINRENYVLKTNDSVVVNSGFLHSAEPEEACLYECIVFDLEYFLNRRAASPEFPEALLNRQKRIKDFFPADETVFCRIFSEISDALRCRGNGYTMLAEGAILTFIGLLLQKDKLIEVSESAVLRGKKSDELKTVLNYIALHYPDKITLRELADCVHMNPNYFCRFFKEMTRRTPMDYLNQYRIECACEKLCTKSDSILNISLDCGFNDANYFIKVFKKHKGCTPLQYINKTVG